MYKHVCHIRSKNFNFRIMLLFKNINTFFENQVVSELSETYYKIAGALQFRSFKFRKFATRHILFTSCITKYSGGDVYGSFIGDFCNLVNKPSRKVLLLKLLQLDLITLIYLKSGTVTIEWIKIYYKLPDSNLNAFTFF